MCEINFDKSRAINSSTRYISKIQEIFNICRYCKFEHDDNCPYKEIRDKEYCEYIEKEEEVADNLKTFLKDHGYTAYPYNRVYYSGISNPIIYCKHYDSIIKPSDIMVNKIITICGSKKYKSTNDFIKKKLLLEGDLVFDFSIADDEYDSLDEEIANNTRNAQIAKIFMSDALFVINVDKYVSDFTKEQVVLATALNKEVMFLESLSDDELLSLVENVNSGVK